MYLKRDQTLFWVQYKLVIELLKHTVFPRIVSAETILFWIQPSVLWPLITVHTGAETIQGRKLFKGGNYSQKDDSYKYLFMSEANHPPIVELIPTDAQMFKYEKEIINHFLFLQNRDEQWTETSRAKAEQSQAESSRAKAKPSQAKPSRAEPSQAEPSQELGSKLSLLFARHHHQP